MAANVRQEEDRNRRSDEAAWADRLRQSDFTRKLFDDAAAAGFTSHGLTQRFDLRHKGADSN